jgi:hypothetical protein
MAVMNAVVAILVENGVNDVALLQAAALQDTIEDTTVTHADLVAQQSSPRNRLSDPSLTLEHTHSVRWICSTCRPEHHGSISI